MVIFLQTRSEIFILRDLRVKFAPSSWDLLRQYKLPDDYRLTQESLNGYYKAVNEAEPSKRLRMLRARNVERDFQVYPPYWYYRAKAAQESDDDSEALRCWDKFAEVWRPVLRNDPYKLEEAKYRIQRLAGNAEVNREEIRRLLGVIQDNTTAGDWSNNLFAGVVYFLLGDKDEGIACVETNVDFAYEEAVSRAVLSEMKKGELNALTLYALKDDIKIATENPQTKQTEVKQPEPKKKTSGKRRDLTRQEIRRITDKYGFSIHYTQPDKSERNSHGIPVPEGEYVISSYVWPGFVWRYMSFSDDRFYWGEGFFSTTYSSMSYDDLRNNPKITYFYLQELFKDFPSEVVPTLMELNDLE